MLQPEPSPLGEQASPGLSRVCAAQQIFLQGYILPC